MPGSGEFVFARLRYIGGDWDADTLGEGGVTGGAEINFLKRLKANTSIPVYEDEFFIRPGDPDIGKYPFLYATGHGHIEFIDEQVDVLRSVLKNGSLLLAEDCAGDLTFAADFRREIKRVLPGSNLREIPMDHPLYQSPYPIERILGGDKRVSEFMEGIEISSRLAVIFTVNDLGCAWEGHPCTPGGEEQRNHAFRLGINIAAYAVST